MRSPFCSAHNEQQKCFSVLRRTILDKNMNKHPVSAGTNLYSLLLRSADVTRFAWLALGVCVLHVLSTLVEEWIYKELPGFRYWWTVTFVELAVFSVGGLVECCFLRGRGRSSSSVAGSRTDRGSVGAGESRRGDAAWDIELADRTRQTANGTSTASSSGGPKAEEIGATSMIRGGHGAEEEVLHLVHERGASPSSSSTRLADRHSPRHSGFGTGVSSSSPQSIKLPRSKLLRLYALAALCLLYAQWSSKIVFAYINYATGTVLKSSKLIPTMLLSACWLKRSYGCLDWTAGLLLVVSCCCMSLGDIAVAGSQKKSPSGSSAADQFFGISLSMSGSGMQALMGNIQDTIMRDHGVGVGEYMVLSNSLAGVLALVGIWGSGEWGPAMQYFGIEGPPSAGGGGTGTGAVLTGEVQPGGTAKFMAANALSEAAGAGLEKYPFTSEPSLDRSTRMLAGASVLNLDGSEMRTAGPMPIGLLASLLGTRLPLILLIVRSVSFFGGTYVFLLLVKEFGIVSATAVGVVRKIFTVLGSFLVHPKPFHSNYFYGLVAFLAADACYLKVVVEKERRKLSTGGTGIE